MKIGISTLIITVVLLALILLLAGSSFARTLRCGTEIVQVGDPTIEVLQKCGEPDLKELIKADGLIIEKWTYDCGSTRFMRILTLRGGKIVRVEKADYGTGPARCQ